MFCDPVSFTCKDQGQGFNFDRVWRNSSASENSGIIYSPSMSMEVQANIFIDH